MDCAEATRWIDLLKAAGPTLGILGAIVAWLVNKLLGWCVWVAARHLRRLELMTALLAEIESNSKGEEQLYPGSTPSNELAPGAAKLIENLQAAIGPYKPLAPYGPPPSGNPVYASAVASLSMLPLWVVTPVVRYYSASAQLVNQLTDFRSAAYLALSQSRQRDVIRNLWGKIGREVEASAKLAKSRLKIMRAFHVLIELACVATIASLLYRPIQYIVANHDALYSDISAAFKLAVGMVQSCPTSSSKPLPQPI